MELSFSQSQDEIVYTYRKLSILGVIKAFNSIYVISFCSNHYSSP